MATWIDPEGNRYWIDGEPEFGIHRDDLVLESEQPQLEPEQPLSEPEQPPPEEV
jgi:hypothetical protein